MWLPITTVKDCSVATATITKQPLTNGCQQQIEGKQERDVGRFCLAADWYSLMAIDDGGGT